MKSRLLIFLSNIQYVFVWEMSVWLRHELWEQAIFSIGGALAIGASLTSVLLMWQHLRHFTVPREQRWIVRILVMVPVYAVPEQNSFSFSIFFFFFSSSLRWTRGLVCATRSLRPI